MVPRRARAAALVALLAATPARAAAAPPRAVHGSLSLAAEGLHDEARGGGGRTRAASLSLRAALPVVDRVSPGPRGVSAWGVALQGDARVVALELPEVHGAGRFLWLGGGVAGAWIPSPQDTFLLQVGAFVAEQESLLGSAEVHPRLVAVGTRRTSDTLRLLYGVGYTHDFGRGLPIPFLGALWRMGPGWRLTVLLPVVVRATWAASEAVSVDVGTAVAGEQFRFRAPGPPGAPDAGPLELLHVARFRLGAGCGLALSRAARLGLGAGAEVSRIDTGLATRTAAGAYVTASLRLGGRAGGGESFLER